MSKNAVVFCVTGTHIQLTAVSIASIAKYYNSEELLEILVVTDHLSNEDIIHLKNVPQIYNKKNIEINIWYPPEIVKNIVNYENKRFPEVTLWRLFLPSYFSNYDVLLYLDNDTLVYDNINNFFDLIQKDKAIAAVRDFYFSVISEIEDSPQSFGVQTMKNYINSGVVLFNVPEFNKLISSDRILQMINANEYIYLDQTILNILCEKSIHFLPYEYNYQKDNTWLNEWAKTVNNTKYLELKLAREKVKIRHFVEFKQYSMPWEHLSILDKWERNFWEYLMHIKTI